MTSDERIEAWLQRCADPAQDPFQGMQEAGLLEPRNSYAAIAQTEAALIEHSGLIGLGGVWGGRQMVGRFFITGFATPSQRAAWSGRAAAVAISEPGVGAHPKHLQTRAEADGDGFRITGEKAWVSNAPWAEVIIVFAITTQEADGRKRYSAFLVPRDAPGLTMRDMAGFTALQPSRHCAVTLAGCQVPREAMLGTPGGAYEQMAEPFRDVEDGVGCFALVGAFGWLVNRFATIRSPTDDAAHALGGLAALGAVMREAARAVVTALDAGRLASAAPALIGVRVLAADMLTRARSFRTEHIFRAVDRKVDAMIDDIEMSLSVARRPRRIRQIRFGASLAS